MLQRRQSTTRRCESCDGGQTCHGVGVAAAFIETEAVRDIAAPKFFYRYPNNKNTYDLLQNRVMGLHKKGFRA